MVTLFIVCFGCMLFIVTALGAYGSGWASSTCGLLIVASLSIARLCHMQARWILVLKRGRPAEATGESTRGRVASRMPVDRLAFSRSAVTRMTCIGMPLPGGGRTLAVQGLGLRSAPKCL